MVTSRRFFSPGYLLPRILFVLFVLDVSFKIVPLRFLAFRAIEAARRTMPSCMGPFEPNAHVNIPASYGDLASMGNMPAMRQYRTVSFNTDSMGFHNSANLGSVPESILIGDSFAMSTEVKEDRTFTARLSALRGRPLYNAAASEPLRLAPLRVVAQDLKMKGG